MGRVDWVRIVIGEGTVHCEAHGVGHRLPTVRPIGLRTARLLAEEGVPVAVCRDR
jgi:hypothetical protein